MLRRLRLLPRAGRPLRGGVERETSWLLEEARYAFALELGVRHVDERGRSLTVGVDGEATSAVCGRDEEGDGVLKDEERRRLPLLGLCERSVDGGEM